jgi:hypothetical protein
LRTSRPRASKKGSTNSTRTRVFVVVSLADVETAPKEVDHFKDL